MKASQSGGSAAAENWIGFIMHKAPGPAMYIGPTVKAAKDWRVEKLDPTIAATDVLNPLKGGVVSPQKSRSGDGSTADRVRFKGGFLLLAGANSAATLRQHSIRYMVRDDRGGWPADAEGEGDPKSLSDQRLKTYRSFGLSKVFDISTPVDKGSDIDREYEATDKRRYYVACLGCGAISDLVWEDIAKNPDPPYHCRWRCPLCRREHVETDKPEMKRPERGACWIPTAPDANGVVPPKTIRPEEIARWRYRDCGRYTPGYHLTGEIAAFERWENIAKAEAEAGDDPERIKPFVNTVLGRPYEAKGEGPPWESLSARREADWRRGEAPAGALYFTLAADVQGDGIYWERLGWGPRKECWVVDYGYLSGATDAPLEGAWPKLDAVVDRGFRLASGARVADDLIGVDSGYNAEAVYEWVRRRHNALALKGEDGWSKPAIFDARSAEVRKSGFSAGKVRRFGLKVWLIGTWGLKGALMVYLARTPREDKSGFPTGYHHFPADAEEEYFRQLVAEYVRVESGKGGPERVWARRGPNHWLDCHVYNLALTHHAGLWAWDEARWETRAAEIAALAQTSAPDLFDGDAAAMRPALPPVDEESEEAPPAPPVPPLAARADRFGLASLKRLNQ